MNSKLRTFFGPALLLAGILALTACGPAAAPTPSAAEMTQTVAALQAEAILTAQAEAAQLAQTLDAARTQAVATAYAALTQEALLHPTATPTLPPTATPAPTNTPTVYYVPPTVAAPTATATQSAYSCTVTSVSPAAKTEFSAGADFDAKWTIKNTGTQTWKVDDADFRYVSGDKMQERDLYDLSKNVATGESVDVIVDMTSPSSAGTYKTTWALVQNGVTVCSMSVEIVVK